jgi:hypothetical protein
MHVTVFDAKYSITAQLWVDSVKACGEHADLFIAGHYIGRVNWSQFNHGPGFKLEIGRP